MNRYTLHDRKVHDGQTFTYRTGSRWAVLDRETNRIVDEGSTRYEAQQAVNGWNAGVYTEDQPEAERVMARVKAAMEAADAAAADPAPAVHRFITAQDTTTPRVLVTYDAPDGRQTTERVSIHLADLLYDRGLGDYDSTTVAAPAPAATVEEFIQPPLHPVGPKQTYPRCEHDLGTDDIYECGKKPRLYFVAKAPEHPAGSGITRDYVACSTEHAHAEAESLWGIGYTFPEAGR